MDGLNSVPGGGGWGQKKLGKVEEGDIIFERGRFDL